MHDHLGQSMGVSKSAGVIAMGQVLVTRVVLPIPVILLPPYVIDMFKAVGPIGRCVVNCAPAAHHATLTGRGELLVQGGGCIGGGRNSVRLDGHHGGTVAGAAADHCPLPADGQCARFDAGARVPEPSRRRRQCHLDRDIQ